MGLYFFFFLFLFLAELGCLTFLQSSLIVGKAKRRQDLNMQLRNVASSEAAISRL
jgi:hypothetical protein